MNSLRSVTRWYREEGQVMVLIPRLMNGVLDVFYYYPERRYGFQLTFSHVDLTSYQA